MSTIEAYRAFQLSQREYHEHFRHNHIAPVGPTIRHIGESSPELNDGTYTTLLDWNNWNREFSNLQLEGMTYEHCQLIDNFFWYAVREDNDNARMTRSFCVLSSWKLEPSARERYKLGTESEKLMVLYPPLDAINYQIGLRRRQDKITHYTRETEELIAYQAAIGDLLLGPYDLKTEPGTTIYRCARMPGVIFDENGEIIPSAATNVFLELGFTPMQRSPKDTPSGKPTRIFGKTVEHTSGGVQREIAFDPLLSDDLRSAWQNICNMPQTESKGPDPDTY